MHRFAPRAVAAATFAALSLFVAGGAQAALFEDDDARRAILELRQRVEAQRVDIQRQLDESRGENAQLRSSLLQLQTQIDTLKQELARQTGANEQLTRDLSELQRRQKDLASGVDERMRRFEPAKVTVDGKEFIADPQESQTFEAALAVFRKGDFTAAQAAFADFIKRYPQSGFRPTALFWLGNSQYANRDYRGAIANFRELLTTAPDHPRAPESLLSIANCQIELKDTAGARRTLDQLVKTYPQSEAAMAAKERMAKLADAFADNRGVTHLDETADLKRRFGGLERLYGIDGAANIRAAHVAVVGIGGVGSWAAEALARSSVGEITLVDLDHVAESNINRQVHALDATVGQAKVTAMRERIAQINPGCVVHEVDEFASPDNWPQLLPAGVTAVIDACDEVKAKVAMAAWALHTKTLFISCGAAGGKRLAHQVDVDDLAKTTHDPLLAQVRYRMRKFHGAPKEGKTIGVACVFSREAVAPPDPSCNIEEGGDGSLNCHGYGSVVSVTATFGQCAAGWVLDRVASKKRPARAL